MTKQPDTYWRTHHDGKPVKFANLKREIKKLIKSIRQHARCYFCKKRGYHLEYLTCAGVIKVCVDCDKNQKKYLDNQGMRV